jgi:hypothetical protein
MPGGDYSGGLNFDASDAALRLDGQPEEDVWPYQRKEPVPWTPPAAPKLWKAGLQPLPGTAEVFNAVLAGKAVVLGIRLVPGFNRAQTAPHIIDPSGKPAGGHAVLVVGTGRRQTAQTDDLLMIRNSWGSGWGDGGHAWLPAEYLVDKHIGSRVLDAPGAPQGKR